MKISKIVNDIHVQEYIVCLEIFKPDNVIFTLKLFGKFCTYKEISEHDRSFFLLS